jgi:hypothetical protein
LFDAHDVNLSGMKMAANGGQWLLRDYAQWDAIRWMRSNTPFIASSSN